MWFYLKLIAFYVLLNSLIQSAASGVISSSVQSLESDSTCKQLWTLVISLSAGETVTEKNFNTRVKLVREATVADIPLSYISAVNPKKEKYIPNDHCGIYSNKGACGDIVGWNQTLCCYMPLTSELYRGTGEHCLDTNSLITYQVYKSFNYSTEVQTKGSVSILVGNNFVEYPVKWNSEQLTYSVKDVFYSSYTLTRSYSRLLDLYFFFECQVPLHEDSDLEHMNWFVMRPRREVIDRLFITPDEWIRQAKCLQPRHFLTRTQSKNPEDQYANLRSQKLEDYLRMPVKSVRARRSAQQVNLISELDTDDVVIIEMSIFLPR